jgi:hypothetical protein
MKNTERVSRAVKLLTTIRESNRIEFESNKLTEGFRDLPKSLQANVWTVPHIRPRPLPSICISIHNSLSSLSFEVISIYGSTALCWTLAAF